LGLRFNALTSLNKPALPLMLRGFFVANGLFNIFNREMFQKF